MLEELQQKHNIIIESIDFDPSFKDLKENFTSYFVKNEPDHLVFKTQKAKGLIQKPSYRMEIKRIESMGHLCGYLSIPYKWYLNLYNTKSLDFIKKLEKSSYLYNNDGLIKDINVHGGITFDQYCNDTHMHIIGFDCAHLGDLKLNDTQNFYQEEATYKDVHFVINELINLEKQLHDYNIHQ